MAKISCRKVFAATLLRLAQSDKSITVIATDSRGSSAMEQFARELPGQFYEVGIAEQNAVSIAAGLSKTSKRVFITGPACFISSRAYEQVKVDVAYNNSNVKMIGVSGGVSYGPLGGTHTALNDVACMRALANMEVFVPCDGIQTSYLTEYLANSTRPAYMRMGRGDVEEVYTERERFKIGESNVIVNGNDVTIISCGETVYHALTAAKILGKKGYSVCVLDMFGIKPIDSAAVIRAARQTKAIITVEEHSVIGGLGEAVAHIVAEHAPTPVKILGLPDEEILIGRPFELFQHYGIDAEGIAKEAALFLERL